MVCNLICGFGRARLPLLHPEKAVTLRSAAPFLSVSLTHAHTCKQEPLHRIILACVLTVTRVPHPHDLQTGHARGREAALT